ncbi:MAG: TIM-barrel domain-containing protein [Phycisphaerae bacterium]|jgi:hypothetical protein
MRKKPMNADAKVFKIPLERGHAEVDCRQAVLRFVNSAGLTYYQFKLSATIEYLDAPSTNEPAVLADDGGGRHFVFRGRDGLTDKEIHLEARGGAIDYWVVARPRRPGAAILCMHYGQDGPGISDASPHAIEEFFILCPDRYGSSIPRQGKVCFKLGVPSFRFEKDNNFPHEGGRAIISPYFAALRSGEDWLGVGTMEIPTSEYGLNMTFLGGCAVTDFCYGGNLTLSPETPFAFPRITFQPGDDKLAATRTYIDRLYREGLAVPNEQWESDWGGPFYCFFSDQMYTYQVERDTQEMQGEMTMTENYCNEAFLQRCLEFLVRHAIGFKVIIIDYGWFVMNGQWRPNIKRFADFKATIAKLQAMGKKVLVWYSPYFNAEKSTNYQAHPEIGVKKRDGTPFFVTRFGSEINYQSDFTHPAMRELCRSDLEFMLSPQGLNADGIKIDCTHQPPTIDNVFHDPSWGTGEMFHYRASKFMYDAAKQIKPACCINATAGNPLFNRTYDVHRIHDAMEYNLDAYEERAWAAWMCGAGISDLDDWPSYDLFTVRANLRKIAYGAPSLYAAMRRGTGRRPKASWGYAVTPSQEELELLGSLYEVYAKAPVDLSQAVTIDPFRKVFCRRYSAGPLAGFYAATTLAGNQAVAVYDAQAAHVVSISDIAVAVPLPRGARDVRLAMLDRSRGAVEIADCQVIDDSLIFQARRCSGEVKCYRIAYALPS